jgi:Tetratricopeptide repeat/PEGA domain
MRTLVAALTGWSLLVAVSFAVAEPASAKDDARAHFDEGIALFEHGAFEQALARFRRSLDIYPTLAATTNAALCLKNLGRFDEALDLLDGLPQRFPGLLPAERLEYDGEIAELSKQVGLLELRGAQPGSHIQIDGNDRGTTPVARPLRVLRGPHRVRITRDDTAPFDQFIEVTPGRTVTLDVRQQPIQGETPETPPLAPPVATDAANKSAAACPLCSVAVEVGAVVAPTLGGEVSGCTSCNRSLAWGGRLLGRVAYGLGARWAVSLEGGYLGMRERVTARTTSAKPVGLDANPGTASDAVTLRGGVVGASLIFQPELPAKIRLRLGAGTLFGTLSDERSGVFMARAQPYDVAERTQDRAADYAYLSIAADVGFALGGHWSARAGLDLSAFFALRQPVWDSGQNFNSPDGDTQFPPETLAGRLLVSATPLATVGYEY